MLFNLIFWKYIFSTINSSRSRLFYAIYNAFKKFHATYHVHMNHPRFRLKNKYSELKNKSRLLYARQLHRMYTLANSNMASARRFVPASLSSVESNNYLILITFILITLFTYPFLTYINFRRFTHCLY